MSLDELIKEGEEMEKNAQSDSMLGKIIPLDELERWTTKVILYLNKNSTDEFLIEKVKENAKSLHSNGYKKFQSILGVLKGIKESL